MSEDMIQAERRKKRVERLKKGIVLMLVTVITFPLIVCVCVLSQLHSFDRTLKEMSGQMENLTLITERQQRQLVRQAEELLSLSRRMDSDSAGVQVSGPETSYGEQTQGRQQESSYEEQTQGQPPKASDGEQSQQPKETAEITAAHRVYLTFDDGPSVYTQEILDILDKYEVKATFFVVGKETNYAKEAMRRIVEDGHTIGMHSYSHKYSEVYASAESFAADFAKIREHVYQVTGVESMVYRFPGGSSNTVSKIPMENLARYLDRQGVVFYDWNIASGDGGVPLLSAETLVKNSVEDIKKHEASVVLLHDSADKKTTVEALPAIIENILALEDTVILPITEDTSPVQHIHWRADEK